METWSPWIEHNLPNKPAILHNGLLVQWLFSTPGGKSLPVFEWLIGSMEKRKIAEGLWIQGEERTNSFHAYGPWFDDELGGRLILIRYRYRISGKEIEQRYKLKLKGPQDA